MTSIDCTAPHRASQGTNQGFDNDTGSSVDMPTAATATAWYLLSLLALSPVHRGILVTGPPASAKSQLIRRFVSRLASLSREAVIDHALACVLMWGIGWDGVVWGVVWCRVVWRASVRGVAWCGVVWRNVVWCGVAWCGVVGRGEACPPPPPPAPHTETQLNARAAAQRVCRVLILLCVCIWLSPA